MISEIKFAFSNFWVLRVTNLFQEALVIQFLGNCHLVVHLFLTKSYPRDWVRDNIILDNCSKIVLKGIQMIMVEEPQLCQDLVRWCLRKNTSLLKQC